MQTPMIRHEAGPDSGIQQELGILRAKLKELKDSASQHRSTLTSLRGDNEISYKVFSRLYQNVHEIELDAGKVVEKSIFSKNILEIRLAMGTLEGAIEWLNKPFLPVE